MKKPDFSITFSLRKLIQDEDIQSLIADLYGKRKETVMTTVFLPLANKRIAEIGFDPDHEGAENFEELCFSLDDTLLLTELEKLKVLSIKIFTVDDDGGSFIAMVKIINQEYIQQIYEWITDKDLIINYGIFSLHTFTGEAYCLDNKYIFHTGKGLFRVFRSFLEEPTHILDYQTIYKMFYKGEKDVLISQMGSEQIHQIIGDIREKLLMKDELSRLFITSSNQYVLKPGLGF